MVTSDRTRSVGCVWVVVSRVRRMLEELAGKAKRFRQGIRIEEKKRVSDHACSSSSSQGIVARIWTCEKKNRSGGVW